MKNLVCIVDDDKEFRDICKDFLDAEKIESRGFNCGKELVEYLDSNEKPKLVILDGNYEEFEDKCGFEYCRELKKKYHNIIIIGVSANYDNEKRFKEFGANEFFKKPFPFIELMPVIKQYLEEREERERNTVDDDAGRDYELSEAAELNYERDIAELERSRGEEFSS